MISFQVDSSPHSIDALLKSTICDKKKLPYAKNDNVTYYDPGCVEGVFVCRDFCGKKCRKTCTTMAHSGGCLRGKLPENFLFCPSRSSGINLEYLTYSLVIDKNTKEGKKPFKRMDQVKEEMTFECFVEKFKRNFKDFSIHKVEAWYLSTVKNYSCSPDNQVQGLLHSTSDFAQNLKLSRKHETSEEYFHKHQIALFASVNVVKGHNQLSISQFTSSDNK